MNILITGGTGFVGKKLSARLAQEGHKIYLLVRKKNKANYLYSCQFLEWKDLEDAIVNHQINMDAVINLAGAPIAQRWTEKIKKDILNSRVGTTQKLVQIFKDTNLKVFISTSAVGYYGDAQDKAVDESSVVGSGFLADVCKKWEDAALQMRNNNIRTVILRLGMVLGKGGALAKMELPFKYGFGSVFGDGKNWISWIHIDDLVSMICEALKNESFKGIYNGVSPNPVTNKEFSEKLATAFNKKLFIPVPKIALKVALGEMSEVLLTSQRVQNKKIADTSFAYKYPEISKAFESIIKE